jgi:hypothetical protein
MLRVQWQWASSHTSCHSLLLCKNCIHKQQAAVVAQYKQQRSELCEYTAAVAESLHTWMALVPWNARIQWHSSDYLDKMAVEKLQQIEGAAVQQGCVNKDSGTVKETAAVAAATAAPEWITALGREGSSAVQCAAG